MRRRIVDLLLDLSVAAEQDQVLRRDEHDAGRSQLHPRRILIALHLDLGAQRAIAAVLAIHRIQAVIVVREDVERRSFDHMVQAIPVGLVVARAQRLAALDRVLELGLAAREVDDVHLRVRRRIRFRDVQQSGGRELDVIEQAFDLHVLLQAQRCGRDVQHVHIRLVVGIHGEHDGVA